jgi:outer membrane biosynthesis protein TonB
MQQYTERSYKPQAAIISLVFHGLLILLFLLFALHTPDPPLGMMGGSGIALNYGTSDEGSGDLQTMNTPNPSTENVESAPGNETPNLATEETPKEAVKADDPEPEVLTREDEEVPVEVKVKKDPIKKTPVVALDKTEKKKVEPVTTATTEKKTTNGTTGTENKAGGNNNGDKTGKVGDQGSKTGSLDAKALYGNEGNGGNGAGGVGGNLDMAGWMWDDKPNVKDDSQESGRVVIGIKVDDQGNLVRVWKIESGLSPSVYKYYEDEVKKLSFSKMGGSNNASVFSEGKIIFIKKSK